MALQIKSYQQILGGMIRKLLATTGLNDTNKGSVLSTLLEAAAQEDFAQYGSLIELLDAFSLDNTTGADLDKKASEFGLTRQTATAASGFVTITDSNFEKVSTGIYLGASPPIAGDTVLYVNDASEITFPGSIFIGRATSNFEGPVVLSGAPVNNGSHWAIPLFTPLAKNHNYSETVILAQGGNRTISAGTIVKIPASNLSSEVTFKVTNNQLMADGENTLTNVLVFATQPGSTGNAPLRSIIQFGAVPFNGALVVNPAPFSNARDLESDQDLRDRIKSYIQSLSRGTSAAILSGVIGVSDPSDNKRVASASLIEPTTLAEIARLYIDDGTGFEPTYSGQGYESVVDQAAGTEQFLQLGNYPVVKAQAESSEGQPYNIVNGSTLIVRVNDVEETLVFLASDFRIVGAATAIEVAEAINNKSILVEARTTGERKRVVIFAKTADNEKLQVAGGTANDALLFDTDIIYTLRLYKNDVLMTKDGETAFVESDSYGSWSALPTTGTLNIQVDGKPTLYLRIQSNLLEVSLDGVNYVVFNGTTFNDLGTDISSASIAHWVTVLDQLIPGAEVISNSDKIKITSNQESTADSKIQILGGNLAGPQGWSTDLVEGRASDFTLNRFNGQIELTAPLVANDRITAGTEYTRGLLASVVAAGGVFSLPIDDGRDPVMYVVVDGDVVTRILPVTTGDTITVSVDGSGWRYTCTSAVFGNLEIGDYVAIVDRGVISWLSSNNCGIFKVTAVDPSGFYFTILGASNSAEGPFTLDSLTDIQAFSSTVPPQRVELTSGAVPVATVVSELNAQIVGAEAEQRADNSLRLYTRDYDYTRGSIDIPVMFGNIVNLGLSQATASSIESHVAFAQSYEELGLRINGLRGSETTGDTVSPYVTVTDAARTFLSDGTKPGQWVKWQDDSNEDLKGVIGTINSNTQLTLRDNGPALVSSNFLAPTTIGDTFQQYAPFDIEDTDNLVVVLDGDDVNKTYNVPMSRRGRVSGTSGVSMFDGLDDDANVGGTSFGNVLIWGGYDFADYKVWFKARKVINPTNDKNAMIIRAKKYGPTGDRTRISFVYPSSSDADLSASASPSGDFSTVTVQLGSGAARLTTQSSTTQFTISVPVAGQIKYLFVGGTDPGFGVEPVAIGDIATFNSANFSAANRGTFKIVDTDALTYVTVLNPTGTPGVPETKTLGSPAAMSIFPLDGNTGTSVVGILNSTDIVNGVVDAILTPSDPFGVTNDGTGLIEYSTADDPSIASQYVVLVDGENWIRTFNNPGPPQFVLKTPLSFINVTGGAGYIYELHTCPSYGTSSLGEQFRLIPTTAKNLVDHMNKSTITALSINANVERSADGERVQISSKLIGSQGQVYISGGLGNSCLMAIQGNAAPSGAYLKVPVLEASVSGFHAPQVAKVENQFVTNKVNTFNSNTSVAVDAPGVGGTQKWMLGKRALGFAAPGTSITVTTPSAYTMRLTISAGAGSFNAVAIGDELYIPYLASPFSPRNEGTFPVTAVHSGGTWIEVTNPYALAEGPIALVTLLDLVVLVPFFTEYTKQTSPSTLMKVEKLSRGFVRYRWLGVGTDPNFASNGLRVDDIVEIGGDSLTQANKGKFRIVGVADDMFEVVNENAVEERVEIGDTFLKSDNLFAVSGAVVNVTVVSGVTTYTLSLGSWKDIPPVGSIVRIQDAAFNVANLGIFRVVASSANTLSVVNAGFAEVGVQLVSVSDMEYENTFTFRTVDSTEEGDSLVVGAIGAAWFKEVNQGHLVVTEVGRDSGADGQHYVRVLNSGGASEAAPISLGSNYNSFYVLEGYAFVTYRQIENICMDPSNSNQYFVYFTPTANAGRIVRAAGTQFIAMNKLGFPTAPQVGIDGYKYWVGLLRRVQRTVDGYDIDPLTYPGIKAAGVQVEVTPPLLQKVSVGIDVKTTSGTPLSILTDSIKSAVLAYITSLGVGEDVVLSQIVKKVQEVPGVEAVRITDPAPVSNEAPERIVIQDNEKAVAFEDDITVG